MTSTGFERVES